ncbi:tripartite motif-containing protein 35-like [Anguilla anguilla]|uniref:tripartite motif-containing protein 35-like n=1 Tax=Anguilla anguilla TaxID=7936 RepID=UPI0015B25289|nr:tripartite motif-containing protein 35-like [Anguilla anguilla]
MLSSHSLLEQELSCPVCADIFQDPVVLKCSHSFCRTCLAQHWLCSELRDCPVCRRASAEEPVLNLTLRNTCQSYLRERARKGAGRSCPSHGESLKLFCLQDRQLICVDCLTQQHRNHSFCPLEAVLPHCKAELLVLQTVLKEKLAAFKDAKLSYVQTAQYIKIQTQHTERQIREQFEKLHEFLREEEEARIAALREEEEQKSQAMKEKLEKIKREISSLSTLVKATERELNAEDISLLDNYSDTVKRVSSTPREPEEAAGALVDVAEHLGNLKFRVWEKMLRIVQYTPVTLDPNTAAPWQILSEDLTSVRYRKSQQLPGNPERFSNYEVVLGSRGLRSGVHAWEVEVGENTDWALGVAAASVERRADIGPRPEEGLWSIGLFLGRYAAYTSPVTPIPVRGGLRRVRVELDWDGGRVAFSDAADGAALYAFSQRFTEPVYPYFLTACRRHGLRVLPAQVSVQVQPRRNTLKHTRMSHDHLKTRGAGRGSWGCLECLECLGDRMEAGSRSSSCSPRPSGGCGGEDFGVPRGEEEGSRRCLGCGEPIWGALPVCWACRTSSGYQSDGGSPQHSKEELKVTVRPLKKWLDSANEVKRICNQSTKHNTHEARQAERKIKDEFEKLHRFLREEEEARIAAMREEEKQKSRMMKEKIEKMKGEMSSLSDTVTAMEQQLKLRNLSFLQNYKTTMTRVWAAPQIPGKDPGALIDVCKHLSNLKYRVWKKMLGTVQYSPVILDPNSADPFLRLSEDLTSVRDGNVDQQLPDTPERFNSCAEMLGSRGYRSGTHLWDVEVGGNASWIVGVAGKSAQRKALISACPENRIWGVCLRDGEYMALESPSVPLPVRGKLLRVRVELDWDGGKITFSDTTDTDGTPLYTFTHPFSERVYPYFSTSCQFHPLRIVPAKVLISVDQSKQCV